MKNSLSWARALRVRGVSLTAEERAAGWPEAFTPENLARLQYPWEGSTEEKTRAHGNQVDLLSVMKKAMTVGSLPTVERTRTVKVTKMVPDPWVSLNTPHSQLGSPEWRLRDRGPRMREVKDGERNEPFQAIEAHAFRAWLSDCGEEPGEHVRAWFDATAAETEQLDMAPPPLTEMKRSAIINQLGQRYPRLAEDLNRVEPWTKECRSGPRGMYYLEKIEEGCRKKWGERPLAPVVRTHRMQG
ncbi:hypothetical protein [Zoogloea sp.]|uniref:hypothetical protein n=1 Tax=Zoogloea sp. TaxID=49181 RepID=UPI00260E9362|nr:hypothetical protein [uncultured Zoogloea sp.]